MPSGWYADLEDGKRLATAIQSAAKHDAAELKAEGEHGIALSVEAAAKAEAQVVTETVAELERLRATPSTEQIVVSNLEPVRVLAASLDARKRPRDAAVMHALLRGLEAYHPKPDAQPAEAPRDDARADAPTAPQPHIVAPAKPRHAPALDRHKPDR